MNIMTRGQQESAAGGSSQEDILCERIAPRRLAMEGHSRRCYGGRHRNPKYPRQLSALLENLREEVSGYNGDLTMNTEKRIHGNLFMKSFLNDLGARDEVEEQVFLKMCVFESLAAVGISPPLDSNPRIPALGAIDISISDRERLRIVVDLKSTHS
jgi:hypothetical protein